MYIETFNGEYTSVGMVADFYGVSYKTIETVVKRNKNELEEDGLKVLKGRELKRFRDVTDMRVGDKIPRKTPSLTIIPILLVYKFAFMLQNSDKAKQVKQMLFDECKELYVHFSQSSVILKKYEEGINELLKKVFRDKVKIRRQVACGTYRIDFVINDSIAIEVDEDGHSSYDKEKELIREEYIKKSGYKLIRYDTRVGDTGKLIGDIIELVF
jgi:very-short-patch-repair endonuclease